MIAALPDLPLRKLLAAYYVGGFLDDFLGITKSTQDARRLADNILTLTKALGISCHPAKCEFEPSRFIDYLGVSLDIQSARFVLSQK